MKKLIIKFDFKFKESLSAPEQIQKAYDIVRQFNCGDQSLEVETGNDFFVSAINRCIFLYGAPHLQGKYPFIPMLDYRLVMAFDGLEKQEVSEDGIEFSSIDNLITEQNRITDELYYEFTYGKNETI